MMKIKNILTIVLMLSVILMVGCSASEQEDNPQEYDGLSENTDSNNTPSDAITGNVVAVVNGEDVTSEDVTLMQQVFIQQGQQISEADAIEQAINQLLLEQKVQEQGIVVTKEEAESAITQQLTMQGLTLDDLKEQFESQGISYEAELENVRKQIATQSYVESQLVDLSFDVSDKEAQEFYETYKAQSPEEIPAYEELESEIIAVIQQQKQQEAITALFQELRLSANIEYE